MLVKSLVIFFIILILYQLYSASQPIIEGLSPEDELKDHDAIIQIQSELNNKYKPLITDSAGQPVNLLSRVTSLEEKVKLISNQMMQSGKDEVSKVPPTPAVEPLPASK
jgi:hypothetical protein